MNPEQEPIYDVAILGGGPAGATLARLIGGKLSTVLIHRQSDDPRSAKPCGGLLAGDAQKTLSHFALTLPKQVLVDPQIFAVKTIDLASGLIRHYQRFYINLNRQAFDRWLLSLLPPQVRLEQGRACAVYKRDGLFVVEWRTGAGERRQVCARRLVGAEGANSLTRKTFFPRWRLRQYTAIQQWFAEDNAKPLYSCIFDPETSDCCSWSISKDHFLIFGGAFPAQNCRQRLERQKEKLADYGFTFGPPLKTEACLVLRPRGPWQICPGKEQVFLIGEAAGLISPSSLEGISWAMDSAVCLSRVLLQGGEGQNRRYRRALLPLRCKLLRKTLKCPWMYQPLLRRLVMRSGLKSIQVVEE